MKCMWKYMRQLQNYKKDGENDADIFLGANVVEIINRNLETSVFFETIIVFRFRPIPSHLRRCQAGLKALNSSLRDEVAGLVELGGAVCIS